MRGHGPLQWEKISCRHAKRGKSTPHVAQQSVIRLIMKDVREISSEDIHKVHLNIQKQIVCTPSARYCKGASIYTLCAIQTVTIKAEVGKHNLFKPFMAKGNYMPVFCSPSQFLPGRDGLVSMVVLHLQRYEPIKLIHSANAEQSFSVWEAHSSQSVRPEPEHWSDSLTSVCVKIEIIIK